MDGFLVEPQNQGRTGMLVRRAWPEMEISGDRDMISDGRAATSRGSHQGDGGITNIAEFAMEGVIDWICLSWHYVSFTSRNDSLVI